MLRCVNQLETFDSGVIRVDGELVGATQVRGRLVAAGPKDLAMARRRTGMVFQRFNLFPHRTILENVTEGPVKVLRRPRDEVVDEAHALLRQVGMGHKAEATPRSSPAVSSSASRSRGLWP